MEMGYLNLKFLCSHGVSQPGWWRESPLIQAAATFSYTGGEGRDEEALSISETFNLKFSLSPLLSFV
jgi:hypothetical protein